MVKMVGTFVVIASLVVAHQSFTESCQASQFVKTDRMELQNHVNQTIERIFPELCWGECLALLWCLSINIRNISENEFECDLNYSNKPATGGLVSKSTSDYYEKTRPSDKICSLYDCDSKGKPEVTSVATTVMPTSAPSPASSCHLDFPSVSTANYVNITSPFAKSIVGKFTVSFWLAVPATFTDGVQIFSYKTDTQSDLGLLIKSTGEVEIKINAESKDSQSGFKRDDTWQNIVIKWWKDGKVEVHRDGSRQSTGDGLAEGAEIQTGGTLYLGQKHESDIFDATKMLRGKITDLEIWDDDNAKPSAIYGVYKCQSAKNYKPGQILSWQKILDSPRNGEVENICPSSCTGGTV